MSKLQKNSFYSVFTKKSAIYLAAFFVLFATSNCADKKKEYDKTKAISAFAIIDQIIPEDALQTTAITIPAQSNNDEWIAPVSSVNQQIENFSFTPQGKKFLNKYSEIWSGYRPAFADRFVFEPIIKRQSSVTGVFVASTPSPA